MNISPKQIVEQFHLLFLDQLGRQLDKRLYALKGGCNLRFFFQSIRYSEDIDIDIKTIHTHTLTQKVNKILSSQPFQQILGVRKINIDQVSLPKQTETTQRWKILLSNEHLSLAVPTKIEFSRRGMQDGIELELINKLLTQEYKLPPIFAPHYNSAIALTQKFGALLGRSETQARDVFDINLLLQHQSGSEQVSSHFTKAEKQTMIDNTLGISYEDYNSLVVGYLQPEYFAQYQDPLIWERIQLDVVEVLS